MAKAKFKIVTDGIRDGMIFIDGPNDSLIALDCTPANRKDRMIQAKKITKLLNEHWSDDKKKSPAR